MRNKIVSGKEIFEELCYLGIPTNSKGFDYLVKAIDLCIADRSYMDNISKKLYPMIAYEFDTKSNLAERCIRGAIESAFNRPLNEGIHKYFKNTINKGKKKATNGEFISMVARRLMLGYGGYQNEENC